jgi:aerobic C4-dicarboxylate transport protein
LPVKLPWYRQLYLWVLVAIVAGGLIGHFAPDTGVALKPLGDAFIKLVKMVIAPLIFLTIVTGIAGMRDLGSVGRVAGKAFAYFLFFSTLALIWASSSAISSSPVPGSTSIPPASIPPRSPITSPRRTTRRSPAS